MIWDNTGTGLDTYSGSPFRAATGTNLELTNGTSASSPTYINTGFDWTKQPQRTYSFKDNKFELDPIKPPIEEVKKKDTRLTDWLKKKN